MDGSRIGAALGAAAGVYKSIKGIIVAKALALNLKILTFISWEILFETAFLALIGGAIGWIGAELMRGCKRLYLKWKQIKHDKTSD